LDPSVVGLDALTNSDLREVSNSSEFVMKMTYFSYVFIASAISCLKVSAVTPPS